MQCWKQGLSGSAPHPAHKKQGLSGSAESEKSRVQQRRQVATTNPNLDLVL